VSSRSPRSNGGRASRTLDAGPPRAYTPELYRQKCSAVFEHVFESHLGRNAAAMA
jgi:type I restriction enzyme R subunit